MSSRRPQEAHLRRAFREGLRYFSRPYVTGVSIGEPTKRGQYLDDERAICIHVREKLPKAAVSRQHLFPRSLHGVRVDVVQRNFRSFGMTSKERRERYLVPADPVVPGVEVGVEGGDGGTLGMLVYDKKDGASCALSAAHVLAGGCGTVLYQPGWRNEFQPLGKIRRSLLDGDGDAAIAEIESGRATEAIPLNGRAISGVREPVQGEVLEKSGAATGNSRAKVSKVGQFSVDYVDRPSMVMQGFELRPLPEATGEEISDGGDSGAVWYDSITGEAVGLTVGGDRFGPADPDEWAVACFLTRVFERLCLSLNPNDRIT